MSYRRNKSKNQTGALPRITGTITRLRIIMSTSILMTIAIAMPARITIAEAVLITTTTVVIIATVAAAILTT